MIKSCSFSKKKIFFPFYKNIILFALKLGEGLHPQPVRKALLVKGSKNSPLKLVSLEGK
jgi:hypothetical protein